MTVCTVNIHNDGWTLFVLHVLLHLYFECFLACSSCAPLPLFYWSLAPPSHEPHPSHCATAPASPHLSIGSWFPYVTGALSVCWRSQVCEVAHVKVCTCSSSCWFVSQVKIWLPVTWQNVRHPKHLLPEIILQWMVSWLMLHSCFRKSKILVN